MLDQPDTPPATTVAEALEEALDRIAQDKTLQNAEHIIARGNAFEIKIIINRNREGKPQVVARCQEVSPTWAIYVGKNLER